MHSTPLYSTVLSLCCCLLECRWSNHAIIWRPIGCKIDALITIMLRTACQKVKLNCFSSRCELLMLSLRVVVPSSSQSNEPALRVIILLFALAHCACLMFYSSSARLVILGMPLGNVIPSQIYQLMFIAHAYDQVIIIGGLLRAEVLPRAVLLTVA